VKHLLGLRDVSTDDIYHLLDLAIGFRDISKRRIKKVPTLRGRTVLNAFFEPSTRTRVSFELAGKRLSADTVNISASGSSVVKGESLLDVPDAVWEQIRRQGFDLVWLMGVWKKTHP